MALWITPLASFYWLLLHSAGVLDYAEGTGRDIIRAQTEKKLKETVRGTLVSCGVYVAEVS